MTLQAEKPFPGVANSIFRDIARIMTPKNVPFVIGKTTDATAAAHASRNP